MTDSNSELTRSSSEDRATWRLAILSAVFALALPLALLWIAKGPPLAGYDRTASFVYRALPALILAVGANVLGFAFGYAGATTPGSPRWRATAFVAAGLNVGGWLILFALGWG